MKSIDEMTGKLWSWEPHPLFGRQPDLIGIIALLLFAYLISQDYIGAKAAASQCELHPTMATIINKCLLDGGQIRANFCAYPTNRSIDIINNYQANLTDLIYPPRPAPGVTPK